MKVAESCTEQINIEGLSNMLYVALPITFCHNVLDSEEKIISLSWKNLKRWNISVEELYIESGGRCLARPVLQCTIPVLLKSRRQNTSQNGRYMHLFWKFLYICSKSSWIEQQINNPDPVYRCLWTASTRRVEWWNADEYYSTDDSG